MKKSNVAYPFEVRPLRKKKAAGIIFSFPIFAVAGLMEPHRRMQLRIAGRAAVVVGRSQEFGGNFPFPFSTVSGRF